MDITRPAAAVGARGLGREREDMLRPIACWLGLALTAAFAPGCDDLATCAEHGDTKSCECEGGASGTQRCLPERIWAACDCSSPAPVPDGGAAGVGGSGGAAAAGRSGAGGAAGASGTAGATAPVDAGDEDDAGMDPAPAGSGGSGGAGGAAGAAGAGGATAPMSAAYRGCMNMNDCDTGASCDMAPALLEAPLRVCAPACDDVSDCPVPEGTYEADVLCVDARCRIDCTSEILLLQQTCPTGMTCIAEDFPGIAEYCYDDGA
jgi:hypothetical protein